MRLSPRAEGFTIHPDINEVTVGTHRTKLTPKEMGVLELLLLRSETTVSRQEILENVWGDKYANDQGLTQAVSRLRQLFARSRNVNIKTVPKKGYQLNIRNYPSINPAFNWVRTYRTALILTVLFLMVFFLIYIQPIRIRIQKQKMEDQTSRNDSFSRDYLISKIRS